MASGILNESRLTLVEGTQHIRTKIQFRQGDSTNSGTVKLQARMYYEWDAGGAQTFSSCKIKIYSNNSWSSSALIKEVPYSWTRTNSSDSTTTSWYDIEDISNADSDSVELYVEVQAATSNANRWNFNDTSGYREGPISGFKRTYTLSHNPVGNGYSFSITRQSSGVGATGAVAIGGILYNGDQIKVTANPNTNYRVTSVKVNGSSHTNGATYGPVSGNVTVTATAEPLASSVGATDANIGSTSTITVTKYNSSYYHSLQYEFDFASSGTKLTGYITAAGGVQSSEAKFSGTSIAFTVPDDFYRKIPNSKYGTCKITCRTYASSSSNTVLGNPTYCTFRASVPSTSAPSVDGSVVDANAVTINLTGSNERLVRYLSEAYCSITATAKNYASIQTKSINGSEVSGNSRTISGDSLTSGAFTFSATDSRGLTTTITKPVDMVPYVKLTCVPTFYRPNPVSGEVALTFVGNMFTGEWRSGVSNAIQIQYQYREATQSASPSGWIDIASGYSLGNSSYKSDRPIVLEDDNSSTTGFDYMKSYEFQIKVTVGERVNGVIPQDKTAQTITITKQVSKGTPVFDWGENDFHLSVPLIMDAGKQLTMGSTNLTEQMVQNMQNIPDVKFEKGDLPISTATTISLPIYEYGVIFVLSAASTKCCVILYRSRSGAAIDPLILGSPSNLTITPGVNQITITPSSGAQTAYIKLSY